MITDSLKGLDRYVNLHPRFQKAYEYISKNRLEDLKPGEYEISGREIYCTIWEGEGKGMELPKLEVHDSYIDIHILLEGSETIGFRDRGKCVGDNIPYDQTRDIAFLEEEPENFLILSPGNMAIIFPHDAHAPLIGEGIIKKAVVKVLF
ncbi:MAG: YhcH/YjgK/YiaL family protein [Bacteroidales bacterium]|jgi:YhcH/YjgK/YiaL family protein|nr:YhcH/YjgK/YiaL family protein [Bacteroidales bacterium]